MARRRFFVDQVRQGHAEITGDNARHLTRVLRAEVGQRFEVSDNEKVWLAEVEMTGRDLVRFRLLEELVQAAEPSPVTLYLALIKFDHFEWAVEKATELGVSRIVPVNAERSDRGLFDGAQKRVERWRRIAREASEQSRRQHVPVIADPVKMGEVPADTAQHRVWLDEEPGARSLLEVLEPAPCESISCLVGPEGGWSHSERELFPASGWTAVSAGSLILRAETAVCAALAVVAQLRSRYNQVCP